MEYRNPRSVYRGIGTPQPFGEIEEVKSSRVGFRSVEFSEENSKLLINGKETYVYGVNRHDHHPVREKRLPAKISNRT